MKSDIEIAQECKLKNIIDIAQNVGIEDGLLEQYGKFKAKINIDNSILEKRPTSKLILVTALTPTPAGEGKTTISVGLADSLNRYLPENKKVILALREPSLGPVFGIKGGACGGGMSQVVPMEDINLHFTGDFHAIGAANNLLAAMLDNHIQQGNELNIDTKHITWKRAVDMNDRQLRSIIDGLGGAMQGVPREDGFDITVASEIMAVFCLATSIEDLKYRLGNIVVAYTHDNEVVTAKDLHADGAMTALLKDALKPNLVQTLEHTPAIVHGGPFANIAHGCNSVIATKTALHYADYVVTEAGFGADLGAEKFLDIKCRAAGITPNCVVVVGTVRALKKHGGVGAGLKAAELKEALKAENVKAVKEGIPNLLQHAKNIRDVYHLPCVIVANSFPDDTEAEINCIVEACSAEGFRVEVSKTCMNGSKGSKNITDAVVAACEEDNSKFKFAYHKEDTLEKKLFKLARRVYHARSVRLTTAAKRQAEHLKQLGYGNLPVCVAKTQYSFSDNPDLIGIPRNFDITVRELKVSAGAGFIVALTGTIMTMPGLPKHPAAENIDVDKNGKIIGLF